MNRLTMLAAAAALLATPAAAQDIRVSLVGKTAAQAHADIARAASEVCWKQHRRDDLRMYVYPACIRGSVKNAIAQIGDAQLTEYARANPNAWKQYAAR